MEVVLEPIWDSSTWISSKIFKCVFSQIWKKLSWASKQNTEHMYKNDKTRFKYNRISNFLTHIYNVTFSIKVIFHSLKPLSLCCVNISVIVKKFEFRIWKFSTKSEIYMQNCEINCPEFLVRRYFVNYIRINLILKALIFLTIRIFVFQ